MAVWFQQVSPCSCTVLKKHQSFILGEILSRLLSGVGD